MNQVLTIVGSSARAAACSAIRAGYRVRAGDQFADADLCRIGETTRVRDYPAGLAALVGGSHSGPCMYTGALENYPTLVAAMARKRPLWGNSAAVLRRIRHPRLVADALGRNGLCCPVVTFDPDAVPRDGSWLCKPRRSAGGAGITFWTDNSPAAPKSFGRYFQQYVEGAPMSAVYVAARGRSTLLGITRQLIGQAWTGADGFRYCGSIGPLRLPAAANDQFAAIGAALAQEFNLLGLFGVDAVVNSAGVWPVEVNPRYPASVEILERAGDLRAIEMHAAACRENELPVGTELLNGPLCGKAILFARDRLEISADWTNSALAANQQHSGLADIPAAGSVIERNWPVVTLFAEATDEAAVVEALRRNATRLLATVVA